MTDTRHLGGRGLRTWQASRPALGCNGKTGEGAMASQSSRGAVFLAKRKGTALRVQTYALSPCSSPDTPPVPSLETIPQAQEDFASGVRCQTGDCFACVSFEG